ncbi:MAG: hypothetical protein JW768_16205 [Chitinispirillaceae bacterium]|nr:hypothetical protein [Chitinispirillaceae bacterium]
MKAFLCDNGRLPDTLRFLTMCAADRSDKISGRRGLKTHCRDFMPRNNPTVSKW